MPLTNTQYDQIMRQYNARQAAHQRTLEAHTREISVRIPRITEINREIGSASIKKAKQLLSGQADDWDLKTVIQELSEERRRLLTDYGYPADYLELHYDCEKCRDTGFIDGKKCSCFKQAAIELLYEQSKLSDILSRENFDTFDERWYDADDMDEATGKSSLELARIARKQSWDFTQRFQDTFNNLFFYGHTGVGKTFLTHCIAREIIEQGHSVIYFSAYAPLDELAKTTFHSYDNAPDLPDYVGECDLLIIDDLGTELTNTFVQSRLFLLINERLTQKKPTIISTNLEIGAFSEMYSERTFSRIFSNYTMIKLTGRDIRFQKKLSGGK